MHQTDVHVPSNRKPRVLATWLLSSPCTPELSGSPGPASLHTRRVRQALINDKDRYEQSGTRYHFNIIHLKCRPILYWVNLESRISSYSTVGKYLGYSTHVLFVIPCHIPVKMYWLFYHSYTAEEGLHLGTTTSTLGIHTITVVQKYTNPWPRRMVGGTRDNIHATVRSTTLNPHHW